LTNDEPSDITNGYYYLTHGDVATPHNHPPLAGALNAIPLLFMDLKTQPFTGDVIDRGHLFIFRWNATRIGGITLGTRVVSWVLGCLLGFLLFYATRSHWTLAVGTLFLWSLEPTLAASSALAKTDIAPAFFFFLAVFCFKVAQAKDSPKPDFLTGLVSAMAVTSKFYCLVLLPVFGVLEFLHPGKNLSVIKPNSRKAKDMTFRWLWGLVGFFTWVFLLYLPGTLLLPDHRQPFWYFFSKFREDLAFARNPFPVFFWGTSGLDSHWYYLPVAFLLKEPLPFLFLLAAGIALAFARKIVLPPWQWVPALLFSLAVLPTPNLGARYLMPAIPFFILIAAQAIVWMGNRKARKGFRYWKIGIAGLMVWQVLSVGLNFPHPISYFNELVAPDKKIHFLADSNLDWGQDLKRLTEMGKQRHWNKVTLAYLGGVDPSVYGLDWEPWTFRDLQGPRPGQVYAVNASFFQLGPVAYPPTLPIVQSWIGRSAPTGRIADSWYYFEVPGTPEPLEDRDFLPSAPFLQYRGYVPYTPTGPSRGKGS
jgi:hypothetical protein